MIFGHVASNHQGEDVQEIIVANGSFMIKVVHVEDDWKQKNEQWKPLDVIKVIMFYCDQLSLVQCTERK